LEVYSWWKQNPEESAFGQVISLHESSHPGVTVVNLTDPEATDVREHVAPTVLAGAPPATFQANIGADLLRWTVVDAEGGEPPSRNHLYGLRRLFERTDLVSHLPEDLLAALRAGGSEQPYAVPINIHRLNVLYYNAAKLAALEPKLSPEQLFDIEVLCPTEANAVPLAPRIALGSTDRFTRILLVFENILPALTSADFYERLFRGQPAPGWQVEVRRALACAQYLSRSVLEGSAGFDWQRAVDAVKNGEAVFTVMGDWAHGQLSAQLANGEVRAIPFPGSEGIYVFTSDTFPLPIGAEYVKQAEALLETIASREAQERFSLKKGSIPARRDARLNPADTARRDDFRDSVKALATSGLCPPYYNLDDLSEKLAMLMRPDAGGEEIDSVIRELESIQSLLVRWQNRLALGPADVRSP
jgi:glucose/mannose transport system substrate-binding protein